MRGEEERGRGRNVPARLIHGDHGVSGLCNGGGQWLLASAGVVPSARGGFRCVRAEVPSDGA